MPICSRCGKKTSLWREPELSNFKGSKVCAECFRTLIKEEHNSQDVKVSPAEQNVEKVTAKPSILSLHSSGINSLFEEAKQAVVWQNHENLLGDCHGKEFVEGGSLLFGASLGKFGFLFVTNQRVLFACSSGAFARGFAITYSINLENIASVSQGSFGRSGKVIILDQNNNRKDFLANIALVSAINNAVTQRKNEVQTEKQKEHIQIVLDFSSLKDVMSKGGLVMSTYKCPNCNVMVNIPEAGKVLVCQYCGTPIKPVDIFEKIKSLIQ